MKNETEQRQEPWVNYAFRDQYEQKNRREGLVKCYYPPPNRDAKYISHGYEKIEKCELRFGHWIRKIDAPEWNILNIKF